MLYITLDEYNRIISDDGACYGDLLDYQNIEYEVIARNEGCMFYTYYGISKYPRLYLDWVNNFLTVEKFAEHYNMTVEHASDIIRIGKLSDNFTKSIDWEKLANE